MEWAIQMEAVMDSPETKRRESKPDRNTCYGMK
jgi:hypothetical protein